MNELKQTILAIIAEAAADGKGAITTAAIRENKKLRDEESAHISQKIFELKRDGLIVPGEGREYSVTSKGLAALGQEAKPAKGKAPAAGAPSPPLAPKRAAGDGVEQILVEAEANAQGALDRYLTTVGDPNIIGPLRAARDAAREALKNYRERQP